MFGNAKPAGTSILCRYRDDGAVVFVGRKDDQIKIRGYRVELGEIENTLRRHVAVDDAVDDRESIAQSFALTEDLHACFVCRTEGGIRCAACIRGSTG